MAPGSRGRMFALAANNMTVIAILVFLRIRHHRNRRIRTEYARHILRNRQRLGEFHVLTPEQRLLDPKSHMESYRMNPARLQLLLDKVGGRLVHAKTHMNPISPAERFAVTVKFLATGIEQNQLATYFRIGHSTIGRIITETCDAIWDILSPEVLKVPDHSDWLAISDYFGKRWNFPHCVGAIDGKHVMIQAPRLSGSTYFNYKQQHSIVLMAVCDGQYRFTLVDIGAAGRNSDGGIFANSPMGMAMESGALSLPAPSTLSELNPFRFPYVFVGDEAFPLKSYMMRPFPGRDLNTALADERSEKRIYNYRLSRARRIIENAFGILSARWRIYKRPIIAATANIERYVKATICLHNWLLNLDSNASQDMRLYYPSGYTDTENPDGSGREDGGWRVDAEDTRGLRNLGQAGSNMYTQDAGHIRNEFMAYFNSPDGSVAWQEEYIRRGCVPINQTRI